ncbi:MAG: ATP-binding protein [bacterium]
MHRLRIYEQLLIVYFIAVLIPLVVAALLITNINQHSLREQLRLSAINTASAVRDQIDENITERKLSLFYLKDSLKFIKNNHNKEIFLQEINKKHKMLQDISFFSIENNEDFVPFEINKDKIIIREKNSDSLTLVQSMKLKDIEKEIFKNLSHEQRQIFVIDDNKNVIFSNVKSQEFFNQIKIRIPTKKLVNNPIVFGYSKNQPHVYIKLDKPNWGIVVLTPKNITNYSIIKARSKIIIALVVTALSILMIVVLYALTLRTNIRQLFKGIIAISKGNYKRKIRLILGFLTPFEVQFLANEFNNMVEQIDNSYKVIQEANCKLSKLDEMKSNLIDTVSHEFRTPLTCIKGYTTRLLRNYADFDEDSRKQSLKVIKNQTERLSRMVEDLLVIPDIESSLLRIYPDTVQLEEVVSLCIEYIKHKQHREINITGQSEPILVYADPDRVEQVIINLLDNAIKYSIEDSSITVNMFNENDFAVVEVINFCKPISIEKIENLFDKFTRVEENLTRTTGGTGLGLYIAKGIVEAMDGQINLFTENNIFKVILKLPLSQ